jgi:hypothetical protein
MATFLEIGLLEHFGPLFVVLIIFLILFGLMEYVKAFGEGKRGLHAIIALMVALLFLASKAATTMVNLMVPWFMVLVIFVFFVMFVVRMFGVGEGDMKTLIKDSNVYPWIIVFALLILFVGLGTVFGQGLLESGSGKTPTTTNYTDGTGISNPDSGTTSTATPSFATNALNTLRNPKVLGLIFVLIVAAFALLFLTKTPTALS